MPRVSQEQAKKTRLKIIESAAKLSSLEGKESLTFSNIARVAGIKRSSINAHFKRKDDLIEAIQPILEEQIGSALDFSSPDNFLDSWRLAADNDRMFRNSVTGIDYRATNSSGFSRLVDKIQGDRVQVIDAAYMALGYVFTHPKLEM